MSLLFINRAGIWRTFELQPLINTQQPPGGGEGRGDYNECEHINLHLSTLATSASRMDQFQTSEHKETINKCGRQPTSEKHVAIFGQPIR